MTLAFVGNAKYLGIFDARGIVTTSYSLHPAISIVNGIGVITTPSLHFFLVVGPL